NSNASVYSVATETTPVTVSTVTRTGAATVAFDSNVQGLTLQGGSGNDTYNIESTSSSTPVAITTGAGANTLNVSPTARSLGTIQGNLSVSGGIGGNALVLDDQANSADSTYSLVGSTVSRTGSATISYNSLISSLVLNGGGGNDTYNLNGLPAGLPVALV